jgi:hypothetical protein
VSKQSRQRDNPVSNGRPREGFRQRLPLLHTQWNKPQKKMNTFSRDPPQPTMDREVEDDFLANFSEISELKQTRQKLGLSEERVYNKPQRRNYQGGRGRNPDQRNSDQRSSRPRSERKPEQSSTTSQPLPGNKGPITTASSPTSARRVPRRGRNKILDETNEEDEASGVALDTNVDLEKEEFWDVEANDMRMLRRLGVWRNPVTAEQPDEPALFKTIKTGYDLYAADRTKFRLNDNSATWESNSPSMSTGHNIMGGTSGDYTNLLPREAKKLAGVDSSTLSPLDSVRLTLTSATDMNPRQRENIITAVEGILNRSKGGQSRREA